MSDLLEKMRVMLHKENLKELLRYGFWGVATSFINFFSYWVFLLIGLDYRIAQLISMVLTKGSAYFANKFFVFRIKRKTKQALLKEIALFIVTRGISSVIEYVGLIVLVDICGTGKLFGKGVMIVFIVIVNYVFGKAIVYRDHKDLK